MGNCLAQTQQICCPNLPWAANHLGRGLPTHPTFDYDEIDDLEFDTLLTDPHLGYGHGIGGRGASRAGQIWDRLASLFRLHGRAGAGGPGGGGFLRSGGGGVRGGYQAVPGFPPPQRGLGRDFEDDDALFGGYDEDAELMNNEEVNRITAAVGSQRLTSSANTTSTPSSQIRTSTLIDIVPDRIKPFTTDAGSISSAASHSPKNDPTIPAPRALNSFTSFRPKSRSSTSTSASAAAAAASGFAYTDAPAERQSQHSEHSQSWGQKQAEESDDDGFGQYQTGGNTSQDPLQPSSIGITAAELTAEPAPEEPLDVPTAPAQVEDETTVDDDSAKVNEAAGGDAADAGESDPLQASFNPTLLTRLSSTSREDFL